MKVCTHIRARSMGKFKGMDNSLSNRNTCLHTNSHNLCHPLVHLEDFSLKANQEVSHPKANQEDIHLRVHLEDLGTHSTNNINISHSSSRRIRVSFIRDNELNFFERNIHYFFFLLFLSRVLYKNSSLAFVILSSEFSFASFNSRSS